MATDDFSAGRAPGNLTDIDDQGFVVLIVPFGAARSRRIIVPHEVAVCYATNYARRSASPSRHRTSQSGPSGCGAGAGSRRPSDALNENAPAAVAGDRGHIHKEIRSMTTIPTKTRLTKRSVEALPTPTREQGERTSGTPSSRFRCPLLPSRLPDVHPAAADQGRALDPPQDRAGRRPDM